MQDKLKRIIIKLSGEGLANKNKNLNIDPQIVDDLVSQISQIRNDGTQVGIVVGGGNFWRGESAEKMGIPRVRGDYIGMMATLMNGLVLQTAFEQKNIPVKMHSAIEVDKKISASYITEKAVSYLQKNEVVIFAGGTGRPYFTTDTTSALVACEIKATTILMGKNGVSGIYDSDPKVNPQAKKFDQITYEEIIKKELKVMDATAAAMAQNNGIEILVFDVTEKDALIRAIKGEIEHTKVTR